MHVVLFSKDNVPDKYERMTFKPETGLEGEVNLLSYNTLINY